MPERLSIRLIAALIDSFWTVLLLIVYEVSGLSLLTIALCFTVGSLIGAVLSYWWGNAGQKEYKTKEPW